MATMSEPSGNLCVLRLGHPTHPPEASFRPWLPSDLEPSCLRGGALAARGLHALGPVSGRIPPAEVLVLFPRPPFLR